jgi:hypothetical protein
MLCVGQLKIRELQVWEVTGGWVLGGRVRIRVSGGVRGGRGRVSGPILLCFHFFRRRRQKKWSFCVGGEIKWSFQVRILRPSPVHKMEEREGRRRERDERKCAIQTNKTRPNLNVTP